MFFEIVHQIESPRYVIVEHVSPTFYVELNAFLIYDSKSGKYNFYIIDYPVFIDFNDPKKIIKIFKPKSLEMAQKEFPDYHLSEENYGF